MKKYKVKVDINDTQLWEVEVSHTKKRGGRTHAHPPLTPKTTNNGDCYVIDYEVYEIR